jgi:hypothetical protein
MDEHQITGDYFQCRQPYLQRPLRIAEQGKQLALTNAVTGEVLSTVNLPSELNSRSAANNSFVVPAPGSENSRPARCRMYAHRLAPTTKTPAPHSGTVRITGD